MIRAPVRASHNDITQLNLVPGPLGLPYALTTLNLSYAKLSTLDDLALAQLTALEVLRIDHNSIRSLPEAEKIWASAIAVAYLKTKASDTKDVWVGLWEKAKDYAAHALAGSALSFDQVVPDAEQLL